MDFGNVLTEADGGDYLDNWCSDAIAMEFADAGLRPVTAQPATPPRVDPLLLVDQLSAMLVRYRLAGLTDADHREIDDLIGQATALLTEQEPPTYPRIAFADGTVEDFQSFVYRLRANTVQVTPLDPAQPVFEAILLGGPDYRRNYTLDEVRVQPLDYETDEPVGEPRYLRVAELKVY